jgi:glycolate oxidase FAD binding subunit
MSEVFIPDNDTQLVELVQSGLSNGSGFSISGHNTKAEFGYAQQTNSSIRMSSFNGIIDYDPAELVMQAKAGTPLSDIEETLSQHNQHLAFEPPNLGLLYDANATSGTIGGTFMANLSGSRRFIAGAARDHILGVKAVSGRGEIFKSGGNVIKNVTGYDLSKLLTGSWGTLSIVTELSFKVLPAPPTSCSIGIYACDTDTAMNLISIIAQSPLQASGLALIPADTLKEIHLNGLSATQGSICLIRMEGSLLSIRERARDLEKLLPDSITVTHFENDESKSLWQLIRDPGTIMLAENNRCIVKLSIPPAHAVKTMKLLSTFDDCHWYADAAGAWLWISFQHGKAVGNIKLLRQSLVDIGGSVVLYKATDKIKQEVGVFSQMNDGLMSLNQRLKDSFDPAHILNPDRLFIRQ